MAKINLNSGACVEQMIQFLERDDYRRRTGYAKEYFWHYLKRIELTESQKKRLRLVALNYLHKRMQREFWYMCRFIRLIADQSFCAEVIRLSNAKDEKVKKRAALLHAYLQSPEQGERARHKLRSEYLTKKYEKHSWIYNVSSCQ